MTHPGSPPEAEQGIDPSQFRKVVGSSLAAGGKVSIDLPELPDVPVAVVNAKLFYPDKLAVENYRSSLARTDKLEWREDPMLWLGGMAGHTDANKTFEDAWLYNSYRAGYRAYRENRLEDAEAFLAKTAVSAPSSGDLASVSQDLLGNIRAGRGEVVGRVKNAMSAGNSYALLKDHLIGIAETPRWVLFGRLHTPAMALSGVSVAAK